MRKAHTCLVGEPGIEHSPGPRCSVGRGGARGGMWLAVKERSRGRWLQPERPPQESVPCTGATSRLDLRLMASLGMAGTPVRTRA